MISLAIRFFREPYHPGIDITFEFLSFGLVLGMIAPFLGWVANNPGGYEDFLCSKDPPEDYCTRKRATRLWAFELIGGIPLGFSGWALVLYAKALTDWCRLMHLLLFVKACRETHLRRLNTKRDRSSYLGLDERATQLEA